MPRIFDNINSNLLPSLRHTLADAYRADFCVGYLNLRGWRSIESEIDHFMGGDHWNCRLLIGMQTMPKDEVLELFSQKELPEMSQTRANEIKKKLIHEFREQLMVGIPTNEDEAGLRHFLEQIRSKKLVVKLFLSHQLHAKLYLMHKNEQDVPRVGYLGSSNLTFAGLSHQGELNVDVVDVDATTKLSKWFDDRWNDPFCYDISQDILDLINESWAREEMIPPYHIYLKMAYHLSQEAREGINEFNIPADMNGKLLEFQESAVKIAAHHINKRNGVIVGDVVGLGKTLVGTAIARVFDDDLAYDSLIICPKNLVTMWEQYKEQYRLRAKVVSASMVDTVLPDLKRYHLVIIDESHNLRNREGQRYKIIQDYIERNGSKVVMLTATPYNKAYTDLSSQLRLFIKEDEQLLIKPEQYLKEIGELEFIRKHQAQIRSLAAFDKSNIPEDWQQLMRLYMVRRTRSFIKNNYAKDGEGGRKYLLFKDGTQSYFPDRVPKTAKFQFNENDQTDQYARMYQRDVVDAINALWLPRYGLGQAMYILPAAVLNPAEQKQLENLSKAGKRLLGFARTGLFKRLESSGYSFILSLERHILRNFIFLYAIQNGLPLPIGTQDVTILDSRYDDGDKDGDLGDTFDSEEELGEEDEQDFEEQHHFGLRQKASFLREAERIYKEYKARYTKRFKWLRSDVFTPKLVQHINEDTDALLGILIKCGPWLPAQDEKLNLLQTLITQNYPTEKVLVFSQFADTVTYINEQLKKRGVRKIEAVSGSSENPTALAWRFSPKSNEMVKEITQDQELRVLIATDVLSEGQNLQDCHVVVNYDLPWAIIRLIQRAGRVDRIGQQSRQIFVHTFVPAQGVEDIIRLRTRLSQRLKENAEVVGSDEYFFEEDKDTQIIRDLYNEKTGILDGEEDDEDVDLASYAFQIWKNATDADPSLKKTIQDLPQVVYSARAYQPEEKKPAGVLVYIKTAQGNDSLGWFEHQGASVTENQLTILKAARCEKNTPAVPRAEDHHALVAKGVQELVRLDNTTGGTLGRPSGAKYKTYLRLKAYADTYTGTLFDTKELRFAIQMLYDLPLRPSATDTLNRQLRAGLSDEAFANLVVGMNIDNKLVNRNEDGDATQEPRIVGSLGLIA